MAPEIGEPDTESVTNPRTRPSGPEAVTKPDATMKAATANAATAIQRETRRWSVGGADMANTRPGHGPRHEGLESGWLKANGEIIAREAHGGEDSVEDVGVLESGLGESHGTLWTIGHSTRSFEEFLGLLAEHRIRFLADVRHFPTSQRVPWTAKASLAKALADARMTYEHFEDLGGFRKALSDSVNTGWRNSGFRGYADHMASAEFSAALDRLIAIASEQRTAIMCAEAVPWKCHRSLLSDALLVRGVHVIHILSPGKTQDHRLTPFARVHGTRVTYPATRNGLKGRGR